MGTEEIRDHLSWLETSDVSCLFWIQKVEHQWRDSICFLPYFSLLCILLIVMFALLSITIHAKKYERYSRWPTKSPFSYISGILLVCNQMNNKKGFLYSTLISNISSFHHIRTIYVLKLTCTYWWMNYWY